MSSSTVACSIRTPSRWPGFASAPRRRARLPALLGGAPPRRGPNVPAPLRRAARAARRARGIYQRPSIGLFDAHCDAVTERLGLRTAWMRGEALEIARIEGGGLRVETTAGDLAARRVVLAMGSADQPLWPAWAEELRSAGARSATCSSPGSRSRTRSHMRGRSCSEAGSRRSSSRSGWPCVDLARSLCSPATMRGFRVRRRLAVDGSARLAGVREARWGRRAPRGDRSRAPHGVGAGEVAREVESAVCAGAMWRCATRWWGRRPPGGPRARPGSGDRLYGDGILLATGFHPRRPGGGLLDGTIGRLGLECAACGYPVVDSSLRWGPGLYVTGPLAELEIGPVARNILGARLAGERLAAVARG